MVAQAYKEILKTDSPMLKQILGVYTNALVEVCEGQGLDKETTKLQNFRHRSRRQRSFSLRFQKCARFRV
jgi:hypothetical protein